MPSPTDRRSILSALLLAVTVAPPAAVAEESAGGQETFYGRTQVTAVDLVVEVRDAAGRVPDDLSPADFEVREGGVLVPVVAVERQGAAVTGVGASPTPSSSEGKPSSAATGGWTWHTVLYVDQVLSSSGSIRRALESLAGQAGRLVELGTVELVAANPSPQVLLPPTRSARLVEQRLLAAAGQLGGRDAIRQVRRRFQQQLLSLSALGGRNQGDAIAERPAGGPRDRVRPVATRDSIREERLLLAGQQERLLAWAATQEVSGPRALVMINDGYDLDPRDYYLEGLQSDTGGFATLGGDLQGEGGAQRLLDVAQVLAAAGWLSVNVALGHASGDSGSYGADVEGQGRVGMMLGENATDAGSSVGLPGKLLHRPLEPLVALAEATGGEVVTGRGDISRALVRLGERVRLTYQVERLPDGRVHQVQVHSRRPGLTVRAPEFSGSPAPEAAAAAKARRLLEGGGERGDLRLVAAMAPSPAADGEESSGDEGRLRATVQARLDVGTLATPASAPATSLRVTLAVSFAEAAPFVRHEVVEGQRLGGLDYWTYTLPLTLPSDVDRLAVVVEELASGSWGGAVAARVAELPVELSRSLDREEAARTGEVVEGVYDLAPDLLPDAKPVVLLRPEGSVLTGRVAFDTLVTRPEVARVELRLDGERVETVGRPPFAARIDLGREPRPRTVEAIAYDAAGRELGRDSLVVNEGAGSFRVRLIEPRARDVVGPVDVEAEVNLRPDDRLDRLEIVWNDRLVATLYEPPFRQRIHVPAEAPVGYLAVTAHLVDGSTAEDVVFLNGPGGDERVEVQLVELATLVVDPGGRPVRGLTATDFRVLEESRPQTIAAVHAATEAPLSVGLLLDSSASMADLLQRTQIAAIDFLATTLGENDRAFVVDFDTTARLLQPLTGDLNALASRIVTTRADGYTALCDALVFSLIEMRQVRGRRALVVLTDGVGREERVGFATCLRLVRQVGVPIYMLVLDRDGRAAARARDVEPITAATGGRLFLVSDLDALGAVYRTIGEELRSQMLVTYYPEPRPDEGDDFRRVTIEVLQPGLTARTVAGYYP